MRFYGFNYLRGVAVGDDGLRYGNYYAFDSKKARDEWVSLGSDFRTDSNYRISLNTKDKELLSLLRKADRLCKKGMSYDQACWENNIKI